MMKSYTDLKQSKKLAEILPIESADMRYHTISHCNSYPCDEIVYTVDFGKASHNDIPCWSLAALLDVLPKNVKSPFGEVNPFVGQVNTKDYRCVYLDGDWDSNIQTFAKNPIDACYEMIVKLKEQNLL